MDEGGEIEAQLDRGDERCTIFSVTLQYDHIFLSVGALGVRYS